MQTTDDIEMGEVLLRLDDDLMLPQSVLYAENELTMDRTLCPPAQLGSTNSMPSFFDVDDNARDEAAHIFESLTSPPIRSSSVPCTPPSTPPTQNRERPSTQTSRGRSDPAPLTPTPSEVLEGGIVKPKHLCDECGKTFKRAHNLKIHGRLHSGDKPYACPFEGCEKDFRWKSSIVSHMNWHRTKRGDVLPEDAVLKPNTNIVKEEPQDAHASSVLAQGASSTSAIVTQAAMATNPIHTPSPPPPPPPPPPPLSESGTSTPPPTPILAPAPTLPATEEVELDELMAEMTELAYPTAGWPTSSDTPSTCATDEERSPHTGGGLFAAGEGRAGTLASLSCCRIEGPGDPFAAFLEDVPM